MLLTPHTIFAGTVGEISGNPLVALTLGILSHFLLDALPHYDTTDGGKFTPRQIGVIVIDFICLVTIMLIVWMGLNPGTAFWFGALGGTIPDLLDNVPFWNKKFRSTIIGKAFHAFHDRIQKDEVGVWIGLLSQLIIICLSIIILMSTR
ncbi:MAG: hypothetical protein WCT32_03510 [Patescibacteria group bacterium]|jgi:hypothetical protein